MFEHIKKEIDIRAKRGFGKPSGGFQALTSKYKYIGLDRDIKEFNKGLFVDASRNAAVSAGDRDLKSDVQDKKRREKYWTNCWTSHNETFL